MEIRVIPSGLRSHASHLEEELRIARRMEKTAETAFMLSPGRNEILSSIRRLAKSIERRRDTLEDLDEMLQAQEERLQEHVASLRES